MVHALSHLELMVKLPFFTGHFEFRTQSGAAFIRMCMDIGAV